MPLRVLRYGLVPDTGGAGQYRGGLAVERTFEFLSEKAEFTLRTDRRDHQPYGIAGGAPGAASTNTYTRGGDIRTLPTMPMTSYRAQRGDIVQLTSAGGGGYGDPLEREPQAVLHAVMEGRVSPESALKLYKVALGPTHQTVDDSETARLRRATRMG